jgi:hypothetical protein
MLNVRTLKSGVKPLIEYKKRPKKMKLFLEESDQTESHQPESESEPQTSVLNISNTSLEIFGPESNQDDCHDEHNDGDFDEDDEKEENRTENDEEEEYDSDDDNNELEEEHTEDDDDQEEDVNSNKMNLNKEEEIEEKKRKRCEYIAIKKYKTEAEADLFIRSSNPTSTFKIIYNHLVNCTLLCNNTEKHKMRYKQYKCSCIKSCSLSYVVRACDHCSICKYFVWVTGEHTNSENVSNGKTLQYGVPLFIQKIFEEYLEMDSTLQNHY